MNCNEMVEIIAVAQMAALMAIGIKAGMSPNLVLAHLSMWKAAVNPITKAGRKLILDTVLKTLERRTST
jgi:hypothetical protein